MVVLEQYGRSRAPALEEHIVVADFSLNALPLAQIAPELQRLRERFAAMPGVIGVVQPPRNGSQRAMVVHPSDRVPGVDSAEFMIRTMAAPPGYFAFFNLQMVRGRDFNTYDVVQGHPVVLGRQTAQRLFGPADPIGRRLARSEQSLGDTSAMVVVGVVNDSSFKLPAYPFLVYTPKAEATPGMISFNRRLMIRTREPAAAMIPLIRSVANAEAPNTPLVRAQTMASIEAGRRASQMRASVGAGVAGLLALFLSTIGLYSIVAFAVSQRAREIGIRTALGANRREVVGLFFYRGVKLSAIGLVVGLPLGVVVLRYLSSQMMVPFPDSPLLSVLIAVLVLAVAALATWIPARRAAGVDPLNALRAQ
jgi:putative ABC transport system permease protein